MSVKYWYECIIEIQPFSWMLYFKTIKVLLHGFILVYKKKTRPVKISLNKFIFIKMFNTAKCWDWISVAGGPAFIQHSGKQYVGRWSVYSEKRFKMLPVCQPSGWTLGGQILLLEWKQYEVSGQVSVYATLNVDEGRGSGWKHVTCDHHELELWNIFGDALMVKIRRCDGPVSVRQDKMPYQWLVDQISGQLWSR